MDRSKDISGARALLLRIPLALAAMGIFGQSPEIADPTTQVGRLSYISGTVSLNPGLPDEWAPAILNYPLGGGDRLWTEVGARAEVQLRSATIRLDTGTAFSFIELDDKAVQLRLQQGSLSINLRGIDQGSRFEIDTPDASLILLSTGVHRVDVWSRGETRLVVLAGRSMPPRSLSSSAARAGISWAGRASAGWPWGPGRSTSRPIGPASPISSASTSR